MPTYTFKNKNTGEKFDKFMSLADREVYLAEHPELSTVLSAVPVIDPIRLGIRTTSPTFRDLLKRAHDKVGGNHRYHGA